MLLTTWLNCGKQVIQKILNAGSSASYWPSHSLRDMYTRFILSVCLSVDNMVFRVCFGISTSNFMCMFIVAIGRKAHCFSATSVSKWPPGGHIGFFGFRTLTSVWLWISTPSFSNKILVYMGKSLLIFSDSHFQNGCLAAILDFSFVYSVGGMVSGAYLKFALEFQFQISCACGCG